MTAKPKAPSTILHQIVDNSRRLAESTKSTYRRDLNKFVAFAGTDPAAWTWQTANAFYEHMLATITPQSANRVMMSLIYAAKQRANLEKDPKLDFCSGIELKVPDKPKGEQRALTEEEVMTLLESVDNDKDPTNLRDRALFVVALETGMRRMSLSAMSFENVMRDPKLGHTIAVVPIKGTAKYPVPLSPTAIAALKPWIAWLRRHNVTSGPIFRALHRSKIGQGVPEISDHAINPNSIYYVVKRRAKEAGIADLHPHSFRHTFITSRRAMGVPDHEIAAVTGHAVDTRGAVRMLTNYTDVGVAGSRAVQNTPAWLTKFVSRG